MGLLYGAEKSVELRDPQRGNRRITGRRMMP